jgi:hypothetical protein
VITFVNDLIAINPLTTAQSGLPFTSMSVILEDLYNNLIDVFAMSYRLILSNNYAQYTLDSCGHLTSFLRTSPNTETTTSTLKMTSNS